jgi:phosphatidylglycerophosphate synthase
LCGEDEERKKRRVRGVIGARLKKFLDKPLSPIARAIPVSPDALTVIGFLVTAVAAFVLSRNLFWGGVLILFGGVFDTLDGAVAREQGRVSAFGAFLDSLLDRYSDGLLFVGVAWFMWSGGNTTGVLLSLGSLLGAYGISYARARAEGLGMECKVGVMERTERVVLLVFGCFTGWMMPVLWVLFIGTHVTVLQRAVHVYRQCRGGRR